MPDFDSQLQLRHVGSAQNFNVNFRKEIATVVLVANECDELVLEELKVLECSVEVYVEGELLLHELTATDVFNPETIEHVVGDLDAFANLQTTNAAEDSEQQRDVVNSEVVGSDINTVSDIVRVLDEQENARSQDFLGGNGEDEGQREESCSSGGQGSGEAGVKEGNEGEDDDDEDNDHEQSVQNVDGLVNIVHAGSEGLAITADLDDLLDSFIEGDVAVAVLVEHDESFLCLFSTVVTKNFDNVVLVKSFFALHNKGHPQTSGQSFRGTPLFEGASNDGVSAVRVEDLFSSNLLGDVSEGRSNLVTESSNILQQAEWSD